MIIGIFPEFSEMQQLQYKQAQAECWTTAASS